MPGFGLMSAGTVPPVARRTVFVAVLTGGAVAATWSIVAGVCAGEFADLDLGFAVLTLLALLVGLGPGAAVRTRLPPGLDPSITFLFAMLLGWGAGPAVAVAVVVWSLRGRVGRPAGGRRRGRGDDRPAGHRAEDSATACRWARAAFGVGRQVLGLAAAGAVARGLDLAGGPGGADLSGADLPAVVCAGLVLLMIDRITFVAARPARARRPLPDSGRRLVVGAVLLAPGPFVLVAAVGAPWAVPFLLPALWLVGRAGEASQRTEHQVRHDSLTGLPNRVMFGERAAAALSGTAVGGRVGVFVLDLDRFKEVNDRFGHEVGDTLLVVAGARLAGALRPADTVARLGGDEFAVLLPDLPVGVAGRAVAREIAGRVRAALRAPYEIDGVCCDIDVSIGAALHPDHGTGLADVLRCADLAMYMAKEHRLGVALYGPSDARRVLVRARTTAELGYALEQGQLELHYQPQADLADNRIRRVEALLRWRHPSRGLLLPDVFVPLAESAGLIRAITTWSLGAALSQLARWRSAGFQVGVAINASVQDLWDPGFIPTVADALATRGLPPDALTIEVTDGVLAEDAERAMDAVCCLAELGVALSLDDFGACPASLEALRRLPFGEIKIDRTVIARMRDSARDANFVRAVVRMGSELGVRVVAEGVENGSDLRRLAGFGCHAAQGWQVAPALPAALVTRLLTGPVRTADGDSWHRARSSTAIGGSVAIGGAGLRPG